MSEAFILIECLVLAASYFPHKSIIAATMFHFRVRNGNGWCHGAKPPKPNIQYVNRTAQRRKILRRVGAHRASRKGEARKIFLRCTVLQIKKF